MLLLLQVSLTSVCLHASNISGGTYPLPLHDGGPTVQAFQPAAATDLPHGRSGQRTFPNAQCSQKHPIAQASASSHSVDVSAPVWVPASQQYMLLANELGSWC